MAKGVVIGGLNGGVTKLIKSIQRGVFDIGAVTSINKTIESVDTTKSIIRLEVTSVSDQAHTAFIKASFINGTEINFSRLSNGYTAKVSYEVVEFYDTAKIQQGVFEIVGGAFFNTITVDTFDSTKSLLFSSHSTSDSAGLPDRIRTEYVSNTQIKFLRHYSQNTFTIQWFIVELF